MSVKMANSKCTTGKSLGKTHLQHGVGLIEVLITVLVLSISLLALAGLQTRSLQFNQGAYFRSQANIMAYDIFDRVRVNQQNIDAYELTAAVVPPAAAPGAPRVDIDLFEWRNNLANTLPGGVGAITCDGINVCTVTITWTELNNSGQAQEDTSVLNYSARI